jgi:ribosome-binding factor A
VASLIQQILGAALLSKMSDPRINPALTSITRVEVPEDLLTARVYISVMGTEAQQQLALRAIRHASGRFQELMMRQMSLRNTPILSFALDVEFKKTLQTLDLIERAMAEIRQKDEARQQAEGASGEGENVGEQKEDTTEDEDDDESEKQEGRDE